MHAKRKKTSGEKKKNKKTRKREVYREMLGEEATAHARNILFAFAIKAGRLTTKPRKTAARVGRV